MGRWWSDMNGTVRGFIVILAIAAVIFVLNLEGTLVSLSLILQIVFFLAIAVVLYMFWRDRMRHEIETWSGRSSRVFYGSALLIIVDFAAYYWPGRQRSPCSLARDHAAPESTLALVKADQPCLRTISASGLVLATQEAG